MKRTCLWAWLPILVLASACQDAATSSPTPWNPTPMVGQTLSKQGRFPKVPGVGGLPFPSGGYAFKGAPAPGSASFDGAIVWDPAGPDPTTFGGGSYDVTVDGTDYTSPTGDSLAMV